MLQETRDGLTAISPPAAVEHPHADLIAAYDDFVALLDHGSGQLQDGQTPTEVLSALFFDRSGDELAQRFSNIAAELAAVADAAGIGGFVGGGALVLQPGGVEETVVVDRTGGDDDPAHAESNRRRRSASASRPRKRSPAASRDRCSSMASSSSPAARRDSANPSLILQGFESEPGTLTQPAGVAWPSDQVQVLGERVGERLIVASPAGRLSRFWANWYGSARVTHGRAIARSLLASIPRRA